MKFFYVCLVFLIAVLPQTSFADEGQEAFIEGLVTTLSAGDQEKFETMIHPPTLQYLKEHDVEKVHEKVGRVTEDKIKDVSEKTLAPISENKFFIKHYDFETKLLDMGFQKMQLLVNPTHTVFIKYVDVNGEPKMYSDPVVNLQGEWYIVWPIKELKP